jgi:hypothetical protein
LAHRAEAHVNDQPVVFLERQERCSALAKVSNGSTRALSFRDAPSDFAPKVIVVSESRNRSSHCCLGSSLIADLYLTRDDTRSARVT